MNFHNRLQTTCVKGLAARTGQQMLDYFLQHIAIKYIAVPAVLWRACGINHYKRASFHAGRALFAGVPPRCWKNASKNVTLQAS
jgi:hypothetical protein